MKPPFLLPLLAVAALCGGCRETKVAVPPVKVRSTPALSLAAAPTAAGPSFLGVVRGEAETSLSFKVSGQIVRLGASGTPEDWREGTWVEAGVELGQLDQANFLSAVAAARARAELARASFVRSSELYAAANLSKNDFEAARAQKETAEADLAQAEQNLRDTTLRAPYAGFILSRAAESGEFASAGRAVLRLGDFRRVAIEVGVPDTLLRDLAVGRRCAVRVAAFESEDFTGEITEIGTAAGEQNRLFRVVLKVDNPDGRLKSGMTASVRLGHAGSTTPDGVVVPLSALVATSRSGGPAVFVAERDGIARERAVRTADLLGSSIVITAGLKAGERVVTLGAGQLSDGAAIADSYHR